MGAFFGQISFGSQTCREAAAREAAEVALPRAGRVRWICDKSAARIAVRGRSASHVSCSDQPNIVLDGHLHACHGLPHSPSGINDETDAQLLARAWKRWGYNAPERLYGEYAAAIHFPEERRAVLLRDHVGSRPLYWHWQNGVLSFATFLPVLLKLLPCRPAPDEIAIGAFLKWPVTLRERTLLTGVSTVRPGHLLMVDGSGPQMRKWWRPEPRRAAFNAEDRSATVDAFEELCATAVTDRVMDDAAIGAHLSGGLDSSAVTVLAHEQLSGLGRRLASAYTWSPVDVDGFPVDPIDDERLRLARIAESLSVTVRHGRLTGDGLYSFLQRPIEEEGLADLSDEVSTLSSAEQDGVRVLLSGWGGDEAFSSHAQELPLWLLSRGRLAEIIRLGRARYGLRRPGQILSFLYGSALRSLLQMPFQRSIPLERGIYRNTCYLSSELKSRRDIEAFVPRFTRGIDPITGIVDHFELGHLGERMASWAVMGAALDIEHRYPLVDRRIVEFLLGLPQEMLWADKHPRYLARALMARRSKEGFLKTDPANEWNRSLARRGCWHKLQEAARQGEFDGSCDWLDMPSLRRDLRRGPKGEGLQMTTDFARIAPAVRIWHFAKRYGAVEGRDPSLAEAE